MMKTMITMLALLLCSPLALAGGVTCVQEGRDRVVCTVSMDGSDMASAYAEKYLGVVTREFAKLYDVDDESRETAAKRMALEAAATQLGTEMYNSWRQNYAECKDSHGAGRNCPPKTALKAAEDFK